MTLSTSTACFIDNPGLVTPDAGSDGSSGAAPDGGSGGGAPSMCERYGGYATVEAVVAQLVANLVADCRIGTFFTSLTPTEQQHLGDCLGKQVGVLMKCPGIAYDVDRRGEVCRDMISSHRGLGIRQADFDALIEDTVLTLQVAGVAQADIDALAPALLFLQEDIVESSDPGLSKAQCDGGAGGGGGNGGGA